MYLPLTTHPESASASSSSALLLLFVSVSSAIVSSGSLAVSPIVLLAGVELLISLAAILVVEIAAPPLALAAVSSTSTSSAPAAAGASATAALAAGPAASALVLVGESEVDVQNAALPVHPLRVQLLLLKRKRDINFALKMHQLPANDPLRSVTI